MASKRAPRDPTNTLKYVPGQKRKKSSYSVFKSTYLSSETGKILVYSWNHHSGTKAKHIIFSAMHSLPPRIRIVCAYIRMQFMVSALKATADRRRGNQAMIG